MRISMCPRLLRSSDGSLIDTIETIRTPGDDPLTIDEVRMIAAAPLPKGLDLRPYSLTR
jgi:hypothetical protein